MKNFSLKLRFASVRLNFGHNETCSTKTFEMRATCAVKESAMKYNIEKTRTLLSQEFLH